MMKERESVCAQQKGGRSWSMVAWIKNHLCVDELCRVNASFLQVNNEDSLTGWYRICCDRSDIAAALGSAKNLGLLCNDYFILARIKVFLNIFEMVFDIVFLSELAIFIFVLLEKKINPNFIIMPNLNKIYLQYKMKVIEFNWNILLYN